MVCGYEGHFIAFIYTFNLIVGAGALTMPKTFAQMGWILGLVAIGILAVMRFVSAFLICLCFYFCYWVCVKEKLGFS